MASPARHRTRAVALAAWAVLIVGNLVLLELGFALYHYISKKEIIWLRAEPPPGPAAVEFIPGPIGQSGLTLSPYFGFVNEKSAKPAAAAAKPIGIGSTVESAPAHDCRTAPDLAACTSFLDAHGIAWSPRLHPEWRINNHGFQSPYDYPVAVDPGAFVIGVFGGSVAFQYAFWASDRRSQVLKGLGQALGRPVVVLNFAIGGGKQPQQALELLYFSGIGQRFDLVLNIDGVNELYVGWLNANRDAVDPSMPAARIVRTIGNDYSERLLTGGGDRRTRYAQVRSAWAERARSTRLATVHYVSRAFENFYAGKLAALEDELSRGKSAFPLSLTPKTGAGDAFALRAAESWLRNSVAMAALADSIGARYLHVLQPSQYFSDKRFTDREIGQRNVLGEGDAPLREIVPAGYRAFLERADILKKRGIAFVPAVRLFDRVDEDIYYDWCCHFNERGHRLLDLLIQRAILLAVDPAKHAQRVKQLEALFATDAKLDVSETLNTGAIGPRDAGEANRRRLAAALQLLDAADRPDADADADAERIAACTSALGILGSLYARDPKSKDLLDAHLRAYRARAGLLGKTGDRQGQIADLRSAIAVLGQLAALDPSNKETPRAIEEAVKDIDRLGSRL